MTAIKSRKLINILSLVGLAATISLAIYWYQLGIFNDLNHMQNLIGQTHLWGPLIFILIQIVQVIVPIIPGGVSLGAGVLIFGPLYGFLYNYIGICIGSIANFLLAKNFGQPLIKGMLSEKIYTKYTAWLDNQKRFDRLFTLAIFLPVAPDDALCMLAGLSKMSLRKFTMIILLAKPLSILVYSLGMVYGGQFLLHLL